MENTLPKTANLVNSDAKIASAQVAPILDDRHDISTAGKTAAEYTAEAMKYHADKAKDKGYAPPALVKWIGDASLQVLPKNRLYSAVGLSGGLMVAGSLANIVTGYKLRDGKPVENVATFLRWMQGKVKNYDPNNVLESRNRWIKYAHVAAYSIGGLLGMKLGTDIAYSNTKEKNKNPTYLEEYLTNVSHTQGETWSWLSAASSIWGSASGTWAVPIPGINYATGLIGRITSMQDRNTMVAGLNEFTSGATTSSYLRLKEGMHYLAHYAVGNPAKEPAQIEFLAYTLLGPLFKDKLTADHIKQFTSAVHKVRDNYWQEGGIPKEKRAEALSTMKEVFTGAGLEVLLIDMGLNPVTIDFNKINGVIGKIGDIGQSDKIHAKQETYWKGVEERLPKYIEAGIITKERADWVKEGITLVRDGKTQETPPPPHKEPDPIVEKAADRVESLADHLGIKSKQNSLDKLIRSAEEPDNWQERVLRKSRNMDSPRFVFE